ncbi:hypothetical protein HPB47_017327 [Ixodes persulcatus]|uniref:Uncharacterized protein n=1 Tax=Ixodes persulcatus TaxID=34615 RepID=A0AC60QNT2_IXOPE|nr:hypothetical protein HPB47_017327 [Ixodes persulcatus]
MPWYAKVLSWLLSFARLPQSVALVPDGNRSVASSVFQAAVIALGILQSSVHIFSVKNLMRPEDQKRHLFKLMGVIAGNIVKNWELYQKKRWSVRVPGDLDLLSDGPRKRIATAELLTHQRRGGSKRREDGGGPPPPPPPLSEGNLRRVDPPVHKNEWENSIFTNSPPPPPFQNGVLDPPCTVT